MSWRAWLLGLLTVGVLLVSMRYPAAYLGLLDMQSPPPGEPFADLEAHFATIVATRRPTFILHVLGAMLALAAGPFQFWARLRDRRPQLHRAIGYVYFTGVAAGGAGGLASASDAWGGPVSHWGFGLLAVTWLAASAVGLRLIWKGRVEDHQRWMTLSYALTCAGLTLRAQMPLLSALGLGEELVYQTVAWASWVPQLAWWILRPPNASRVSLVG